MPDAGEAGTKQEAPPSWSLGCATLLVAVLVVCAMIYIFGLLRDIRPPVNLTISTHGLAGLQDITLQGNGRTHQQVRWSLSGPVQQLSLRGVGTVTAILPLPSSDCGKMAVQLQGSCVGDSVVLSSPVTISWSQADQINSSPSTRTASTLEVAPTTAGYVNLLAQGPKAPIVCFDPPPVTTQLEVRRGTTQFPATVQGLQTTECGQGLAVVMQVPGGSNAGLIVIGGSSSVTVKASAPEALAQGFAGPIMLNPGGTTVIGSPSQVTMHAARDAALQASISAGTATQALSVTSGKAASVKTSAGELVPSEWARNSDFIVPLFGGAVTLAVAVLTGAAQELMACVRGLRPRFRRLDLRLLGLLRRDQATATAIPSAKEDKAGSRP